MGEVPKEWKGAGTGEEEIDWVWYDLVASGTTASATKTFFNHSKGADGLAVTNMEIAGQLPSSQRFLIKSIELLVDVNAASGDAADVLDSAVLELYISGRKMFSAPAAYFLTPIATSQTTTADTGTAHRKVPFELDKYIVLNGGTDFRVDVLIGKTAPSASTDLTVLLRGRLVRPQ